MHNIKERLLFFTFQRLIVTNDENTTRKLKTNKINRNKQMYSNRQQDNA